MKLIYDDRIETYLMNEMTDEERAAFEKEMSQDEELRTSVRFYREAAYSAERIHDRELLAKESRKMVYRIQDVWFRLQRLYYRARIAVISALSAVVLLASSLGAALTYVVQTTQRLLLAGGQFVPQLAIVSRDADDTFDDVDRLMASVREFIEENRFTEAQDALDMAAACIDSIADGDNSDIDPVEIKIRKDLTEFTQAVLYTQERKGMKAKKLLKQISSDEDHSYCSDARKLLSE